jgi:hypothetical protein
MLGQLCLASTWRTQSHPLRLGPAPDGFVGCLGAAPSQELFDIAEAKREPEIELHRVPDDLDPEMMASVGDRLHSPALSLNHDLVRYSCDNAATGPRRPRDRLAKSPEASATSPASRRHRGFLPWRLSNAGPQPRPNRRVRAGIRNLSQKLPFVGPPLADRRAEVLPQGCRPDHPARVLAASDPEG